MARGQAQSVQNTAANIERNADTQQGVSQGRANENYAAMMPEIAAMMSPGGDPAITAATMGALGSQIGANQARAMDTAARTKNAASTNATLENLGRTQGQLAAQTAAQNVAQQKEKAMGLLSQLFGTNTNEFNDMLNTRLAANQQYAGQKKPGLLKPIMSGVGSLIGAAAGAGA